MKHHAAGLEAIIVYKLVKAVLEAALGVLLIVLLARGPEAAAATVAEWLVEHVPGAWSLRAATAIVLSGTAHNLRVAAALAVGDGVLSAIEGISLQRDYRWGPWLVVIATASLLPFEVVELLRKGGWQRVAVLVANVAVVAYVVHDMRRVRALRRQALPSRAEAPADRLGP